MRLALVCAAVLLSTIVTLPSVLSLPTSESRRYVGGPGDNLAYGFCDGAPDKPTDGIGGACFTLPAGATTVSASIADKTTLRVVGLWYFTDSRASLVTDFHPFCGSASGIAVPPGAAFFWVNVEDLYSDAACGSGLVAPATAGTIAATFS